MTAKGTYDHTKTENKGVLVLVCGAATMNGMVDSSSLYFRWLSSHTT